MNYTLDVKAAMVKANLTQIEMAEKLGMTQSTFNKKLNRSNGNCFTIDEAVKISNILNCTFKDIFFVSEVA
ncbi:MAG: helix-turn-helix transcriptional regulator [Candidatus Nanoarchaeia archaeon]|nr:helix-turn-helix transcriptional regulator [Candidatus Nanoarchaeia archaeon]